MGLARSRSLTVTADGSSNFTQPLSAREGVNFAVSGLFNGTAYVERRGTDNVWARFKDNTETAVSFTAPGNYQIAPLGSQAEWRLNMPSGSFNLVSDNSTSSVAIGTGDKTFTVTASKPYVVGQPITIASDANPTVNFMVGVVKTYSGTTLVATIATIGGSGTKTDWDITTTGSATLLVEGR